MFSVILAIMSADDFYGPVLPPGFKKSSSVSQSPEPPPVPVSGTRKRHHRSSSSDSSSSSKSSRGSDRPEGDSGRSLDKEPAKLPERMFGPALPAGFTSSSSCEPAVKEASFIGPVLPSDSVVKPVPSVNDDDDDIGPLPSLNTESKTQSTIEQIESRAKVMKDKLEGKVLFFCVFEQHIVLDYF